MAKFSKADSGRMYSWWWDSHISPKNSKWLQENLTDMDAKVKMMIKLIEEDADSFARRAEMYYKKRPELMKLVEEFYRAYRALSERYDHATGVIRHAHRTMTEAFPNQVPLLFADESPDPSTPIEELSDDSDSVPRRKTSKQFKNTFVARSLHFDGVEEKEDSTHRNGDNHDEDPKSLNSKVDSSSEEILVLKAAIVKLEAEKEAGLSQYQQSLDKLSRIEIEVAKTKEDIRVLSDRAKKAENEVVILNEKLSALEADKESKLQDYQQCVEKMSKLQEDAQEVNERANSSDIEVQPLKGDLEKLANEKDVALNQYMQSLGTISNLENKLLLTEEDAMTLKMGAEKAESEVEVLRETVSKLTEEKEAAAQKYQQCLETLLSMEEKLKSAQEEAKRLNSEIDTGVEKLKGVEEQCSLLERSNRSLHLELEALVLKMGTQTHELTEKQKELGRFWTCIQEERLRFVEAETAFQTLQHLHAKTQEEIRGMASELQNRAQLLKAAETEKQSLQDEVLKVKEENKHLDEVNVSSALSMKDMKNEILGLVETKERLQEEVELRLDERNALQQEIYCLKEELNEVNERHLGILDQVNAVGLNAESLGSSVKEMKDVHARLKETCEMERREKSALLSKLEILDKVLEKNTLLETSLSDLNAELEATREKIKELEWSMQSLLKEKSTLLDDKATLVMLLEETNNNLEKLSQNNTVLENSLSDAHHQLEALMDKSRILEDSHQLLVNEKTGLKSENDGLASQLVAANMKLEDLGKLNGELEGRCAALEQVKDSTLRKAEELELSLEVERQEHAKYVQTCQMQFKAAETEMSLLQEECKCRERELDRVMDMVIHNDLESFILSTIAQEMKEMNYSLIAKNVKLLEESSLLEKEISWLEENSLKQRTEIMLLSDQVGGLRAGTRRLLEEVLDPVEDFSSDGRTEDNQACNSQLLIKLQNMKESGIRSEEEKLAASVQVSVLLTWVRQVMEMNYELRCELREEECSKKELVMQTEDLNAKLVDIQGSCQVLQIQKSEMYEEKRALVDKILQIEEKINVLEEENYVLNDKVLDLENLSLIFRTFADEKVSIIRELCTVLNKLQDVNAAILGKSSLTEGRLEESRIENLHLKQKLQKTEEELKDVVTLRNHLNDEIESRKALLQQMALELKLAEDSIRLVEIEKSESNKTVEDLRTLYDEAKMNRDEKDDQILKLSADNDQLNSEKAIFHEANHKLEVELKKKLMEISELESGTVSLFGQLQYFMVSQLLHEHKLKELRETCGCYMDQIAKLLADNDQLSSEKASLYEASHTLEAELQKRLMDVNELESEAASFFGQLQHSMLSQFVYEQKFNELREACLGYTGQNEGLRIQLAAFAPEIESLKECILSLEGHANKHSKFQHPVNEELQVSHVANGFHESNANEDEKELVPNTLSDLRDIRARLQVIAKSEIEVKELMIQENTKNRRNKRPVSEIIKAESILLTKDIVLDQISDGSSNHFSKREPFDADNQVELWETSDPESTIGLTVSMPKKIASSSSGSNTEFRRAKSMKKQNSRLQTPDSLTEKDLTVGPLFTSKRSIDPIQTPDSLTEKDLTVGPLFTSKRSIDPIQEANKRKILERLDSDVQKLANLQITIQDMKMKLNVTEKGRRGKAVIECEALKGQLEEADTTILKLFDLNGSLMKSINDRSFSDMKSYSSFDLEGENGDARRKISHQGRRMSEKIGRLQVEVQKLQFILMKLDDEKEATNRVSTRRRRILRDYLYGGGRTSQRRKKAEFCSCMLPSTKD